MVSEASGKTPSLMCSFVGGKRGSQNSWENANPAPPNAQSSPWLPALGPLPFILSTLGTGSWPPLAPWNEPLGDFSPRLPSFPGRPSVLEFTVSAHSPAEHSPHLLL